MSAPQIIRAPSGEELVVLPRAEYEALLERAGDRSGALQLYDEFAARLKADFGADPSPETLALIRQLRAKYPHVKCMLVSNYADAQTQAVQAGALPGFGKRELGTPKVPEMIRTALAERAT